MQLSDDSPLHGLYNLQRLMSSLSTATPCVVHALVLGMHGHFTTTAIAQHPRIWLVHAQTIIP